MNAIEAIMARKSVRGYLPKPVEDEKLNTILAAGNKAAHAGPLFMTVIRDRSVIDDIDAKVKAAVEVSDNAFLKGRFAIPGYTCTYGAPVLIILSAPAEGNGKANAAGAAANSRLKIGPAAQSSHSSP